MNKTTFFNQIESRKAWVMVLLIAVLGGGLFFLKSDLGTKECRGCNVILISIDTLSAKHLGIYGYNRPTSPFLDKFSQEGGVIFDNAIVQAPWTLPSHAAMLTSKYPAELGIWSPLDSLPPEVKTIAEVMQERGFATKAISNGAFVQPEWGFDQGFEEFSGTLGEDTWNDSPRIFNDGLSWINTRQDKNKPFFLFIRSFHVHDPYLPSRESLEAIGASNTAEVRVKDIVEVNSKDSGASAEEIARFRDAYDGEIRDLDKHLEEFFSSLQSQGLLDKTLVILTADHGEEFGEHGITGFHGINLYDETIRVPLIVFQPKVAAKRVREIVEVREIPVSILDLLGLKNEPNFKSFSFADSIFGISSTGSSRIAFTTTTLDKSEVFPHLESSYKSIEEFGKTIFPKPRQERWDDSYASSARSTDWHLIHTIQGDFQLYNLLTDPEEKNDLYPNWSNLPAEDRQKVISLLRVLGTDVPVPCGIYCAAVENDR